jgi:hypothetical protein
MKTETELTTEQRATVKLLADRVIADERAHARGAPKQFPDPWTWAAQHGDKMMELPLANGKVLGDCTRLDMLLMAEAHKIVAEHFGALEAAARLLANEQRAEQGCNGDQSSRLGPRAPKPARSDSHQAEMRTRR